MPNIDVNTLIQYVQHTWNILFKDITEIRNADKIIYELQGTNEQLYILKGERTNLDSVEHNCQFANQLNTIFPTPLYIKSVDERYTVLYVSLYLLVTALAPSEQQTSW